MINSPQKKVGILQDRYGLKTASYLSAGASDLSYDISERLRAARVQAVSKRKIAKMESADGVFSAGRSASLSWGSDEGMSWWARIGSIVPLIALVVGLLAINSIQSDNRDQELAEVDAALLTDELPPAAFADPGFIQFLKTTR
jgi:Protein of unknown function (DUF3619)